MEDCLFCKIIEGEIPSKTIYEDEIVKVMMDINPISDGHLLVLPKKHNKDLLDLDDETALNIKKIIVEILIPKLKNKLNCEGVTICQNNGLGQEIKHFHVHLIPRYENDNINMNSKENIENLEEIYNKLMD
ncbi:MAG: HIT domain-containing protein [Bacilli bacterium]|nr:HIT domain-containing protein [Bacilli bacterium]